MQVNCSFLYLSIIFQQEWILHPVFAARGDLECGRPVFLPGKKKGKYLDICE